MTRLSIDLNVSITVSEPLSALLNSLARALAHGLIPAPVTAQAAPPGDLEVGRFLPVDAAEGASRAAVSNSPPAGTPIPAGGAPSDYIPRSVWLTEERKRVLHDLYPTEPVFQNVFASVEAASPGVPMPKRQALRTVALDMGLSRPDNIDLPGGVSRANLFSRGRVAEWLTPERRAFMEEHYPAGMPLDEFHTRLAAVSPDAPPIPNKKRLQTYASMTLHLHRKPKVIGPSDPPPPAEIAAAPSPEPPTPDDEPSSPLPADLQAAAPEPAQPQDDPPSQPAQTPVETPVLIDAEERLATKLIGLATKAPPTPLAPRQPMTPIYAGQNDIIQACEQRGWPVPRPFDIDAVNAMCARVGHPGFILKPTFRRVG